MRTPLVDFYLCGADLMAVEIDGRPEFRVIEVNSAPGFAYCTPGQDAAELAYGPTVEIVLAGVPPEELAGLAFLTESKVPIETTGFAGCFEHALGRLCRCSGRRISGERNAGDPPAECSSCATD